MLALFKYVYLLIFYDFFNEKWLESRRFKWPKTIKIKIKIIVIKVEKSSNSSFLCEISL